MPQRYIDTTLFDLFKVGPGPSSSHTIGPMKAGHHFAETCAALPRDLLVRAVRFRVRLYGSLSATGTGHGTDAAVVAGLLGTAPESCPAGLLQELMDDPHTRRKRSLGDGQVSVCVDDVSHDAIIHDFPYSNTLVADLLDAEDKVLHSQEYYSVGGGFIQWKGWEPPSLGEPVHRYSNMTELRAIVKEKGLNIYEIILDNEMAITGASRPSIIYSLNQIIDHMESSVRRGLDSEGQLPGPLKVQRKARMLWQQASRMQSSPDQFLTRINAYAFATAEENASGGVIVTAPTCGSAGVMPALVYALRHEMFIGDRAIREAFLASAAVGFIAKLPHHLVEAFRATLEELEYADLLIHVIDSADPERDDHIAVVDRLIAELAAPGTPVLECYNKCDLVADDEIPRGQDKVAISAASGFGLDALKEAVEQLLGRGKHHVKLLLPYSLGGMVAALHDTAQVLSSSYTENGIELDAIVDETLFGRLRQYVTEEV